MPDKQLQSKQNLRRILGFIVLFSLILLFFNLGGRSIENHDNPVFSEIAREILETGDWVMMHNQGKIYVDKPPLHTWNIALSYRLFGINPMAARFPAALFGLFGVWAILYFGLGVEKDHPRIGIYAALFLLVSYGFSYYARTARNDIEYSIIFSLSLLSFYMGYETPRRRNKIIWYIFFWFLLACAFLVKGPAALLVLVIMGIYLVVRKDRNVGYKILLATSPVLLIASLPWIVLLIRHPNFAQYLELLRTTTIFTRRAGPFYYFPELFLKYFPGSVFLLISIPILWRSRTALKDNPRLSFCLVWAVVYFFILHLTGGKNHRYLLPIFLPLSILTAWGTEKLSDTLSLYQEKFRYNNTRAAIMAFLVCIVVPVGLEIYGGWSWKPLFLSLTGAGAFFFIHRLLKDEVILICTFCALSIITVDLIRTAGDRRVSDELQVYEVLQKEDLAAQDILICGARIRALDFYFNRVLARCGAKSDIKSGFKAVVTGAAALDEVIGRFGQPIRIAHIPNHRNRAKKDLYILFVAPEQ